MELKDYVRSIPDFPKKGILYRDITPMLENKDAFQEMVNQVIYVSATPADFELAEAEG